MNAVPAKVAGVERIVMVTPAPDGKINPLVLAAAQLAGVDEVYRIGGAQAVAALAYGTATIAPVVKIIGPGNAFVAAAKRQVFGQVGIDMIAGPSEVLVVADRDNDPAWIAADLLAQAEHDTAAQAILITDDAALAHCGRGGAVERQLAALPRGETARASWRDFGAIILVEDLSQAPASDRPHRAGASRARGRRSGAVRRKGPQCRRDLHRAAYAGVIGDYVAGSNHVLPTARSARFSSGLSVLDFMKRTSHPEARRDEPARARRRPRSRSPRRKALPRMRARSPSA